MTPSVKELPIQWNRQIRTVRCNSSHQRQSDKHKCSTETWGSTQWTPMRPSFILRGCPSLRMFFGVLSVASCRMTTNPTPRKMVSIDPSSPVVTSLLPQITNLAEWTLMVSQRGTSPHLYWNSLTGVPKGCLAPKDYFL